MISPRLEASQLSDHLSQRVVGNRQHLASSAAGTVYALHGPPASEQLLRQDDTILVMATSDQLEVTRKGSVGVNSAPAGRAIQVSAEMLAILVLHVRNK